MYWGTSCPCLAAAHLSLLGWLAVLVRPEQAAGRLALIMVGSKLLGRLAGWQQR